MCQISGYRFSGCGHFEGSVAPCAEAQQLGTYCDRETITEAITAVDDLCQVCGAPAEDVQEERGDRQTFEQQPETGSPHPQDHQRQPPTQSYEDIYSVSPERHAYQQQSHPTRPANNGEGDEDSVSDSSNGSDISSTAQLHATAPPRSVYSQAQNVPQEQQEDGELHEAETQAAIQASLHHLQAQSDGELQQVLRMSHAEHQQYEDQLVMDTLSLSLQNAESENEAQEKRALHQAKLESFRSLTEDMSRQHAARQGRSQTTPREAASPANCGATAVPPAVQTYLSPRAVADGRSVVSGGFASTIYRPSSRSALRTARNPSLRADGPAADAAFQTSQHPVPQHRPDANDTVQPAGYDWTRPPPQHQSPSPTVTIRTAQAQRAAENQRRNNLYGQRPQDERSVVTLNSEDQSVVSRSTLRE